MERIEQEKIDFILKIIRNIEYGSLFITIHEGQITQVDRTEKSRFDNSNNKTATKKL
jgi:hypothetical protein